MKNSKKAVVLVSVLCVCSVPVLWAGTYEGLEPGVSTRSDADQKLGRPVREIEADRLYDYDPRGTGRRISIHYHDDGRLIEFIELEPSEAYTRQDYVGWFELLEPTVAQVDDDGNRVEYHLIQGVSLHFDGSDESSPVVYFRHFDRDAFLGANVEQEAVSQAGTTAEVPSDDLGRCREALGIWRWFNGAMVECFEDGSCAASNGFGGPWECLDPSGRIEIRWARPGQAVPYVDTLQLSRDAWALEGVNQSGQGVGGQRPEFTGGEPQPGCRAILGNWRWFNGALVECVEDGTCTSSHGLSGPWRCITSSGRFEIRWGRDGRPDQFIDTFLMSPLGSYFTGRNQYGVGFGATRD